MGRRGTVTLVLSPDEAEFLARCVAVCSPRDQSAKEIQELASRAREEADLAP